MSDLDPAVLRERAERLRAWPGDMVSKDAADALDLLADLLDAIGDSSRLRRLGTVFNLPYLIRIAAVLEAHRD